MQICFDVFYSQVSPPPLFEFSLRLTSLDVEKTFILYHGDVFSLYFYKSRILLLTPFYHLILPSLFIFFSTNEFTKFLMKTQSMW